MFERSPGLSVHSYGPFPRAGETVIWGSKALCYTAPRPPLHGWIGGVILLGFIMVGMPASAHKLKVFAFADGAHVEGQAYYAGGAKAAGARIIVEDAAGRTLTELAPAKDGGFTFEARAPVDHLIVAESADGHRAAWQLTAGELAGGFPQEDTAGQVKASSATAPIVASIDAVAAETPIGAGQALDPTLEASLERAVARQVRPLREELVAARDAIRLQDILGAIGYIFGLTGVALWWRSRRLGSRR